MRSKPGGRTMTRQSLQRLGPHAGNPRQAREASDLAAARAGESSARSRAFSSAPASPASPRTTAPARTVRWERVEIEPDGQDHDPLRPCRDGQRHRHGARQPGGDPSRRRRRRSLGRARRQLRRRSGSSPPAIPTRWIRRRRTPAEKNPRWVPAISSATSASIGAHVGTHAAAEAARVIFRFGLWPAALELWRIAPTDPRAKDWAKAQLERRAARHAGSGAAGAAGARRKGACAQFRDRRDGARLFPLGLVARDASRSPASNGPRRHRCAGGAQGRRQIRAHRSRQRQVSADRQQPDRHHLHLDVRHAGPRRDRARDRRAAHRQGLQRVRMRPGAGAGGRAGPGAGRLRDGRRLCAARDAAALRRRPRQRAMESRPIPRRARIGPAAARSRDRDAAAADAGRTAEGHGGSRDDPGRAGAAQRHLRRHRPPLPVPAGDRKPCSRERSRDHTQHHDQRPRARPDGRARRSDDERFPARVSRHDRHQVRLRRRAVPELRGHRRQCRTAPATPARPASFRR